MLVNLRTGTTPIFIHASGGWKPKDTGWIGQHALDMFALAQKAKPDIIPMDAIEVCTWTTWDEPTLLAQSIARHGAKCTELQCPRTGWKHTYKTEAAIAHLKATKYEWVAFSDGSDCVAQLNPHRIFERTSQPVLLSGNRLSWPPWCNGPSVGGVYGYASAGGYFGRREALLNLLEEAITLDCRKNDDQEQLRKAAWANNTAVDNTAAVFQDLYGHTPEDIIWRP